MKHSLLRLACLGAPEVRGLIRKENLNTSPGLDGA